MMMTTTIMMMMMIIVEPRPSNVEQIIFRH
jgi:hypothetical protein